MKTNLLKLLVGTLLGGVLFTNCATRHTERVVVSPTGAVVVSTAPPAVRHEVVPVSPGESYVWVPGYWAYQNTRWVWVSGHYENRPQPGALWVSGHWDHTRHGWIWTPGHWE
jgi:hypothetical protein